jgi:hypothetical protein
MTAQDIINSGHFDAAVMLMDDDIREELHDRISPCTDLEFMEEYMKAHAEKYGLPFII